MFEKYQNISRRKTQITKQTTLLLKTESQEVIVDVSWSECSNLNVINITISMRYLSSPIISSGLVITTLGAQTKTTDEYYCSVSVNIPHHEDED